MGLFITAREVREATFTTRRHLWHGDCYAADEVDDLLERCIATLELQHEANIQLTQQLLERKQS